MTEYLCLESLDSLRADHESDKQWQVRRKFIEKNLADYPKNRLLCLAQIYINVNFLGCRYSAELTAKVNEMGVGICEELLKDKRRSFEKGFANPSARKKSKREAKNGNDIVCNSPCSLKRMAQMTVLEKGLGPLKSLNQLTSRLRFSWDLKALDDGRTALRVNDVVVLEGIFLNDADGKNFVASAALAAISRDNTEIQAKNGVFELWKGEVGPSQCYTDYVLNSLKKAAMLLPQRGTSFSRLESALQSVSMPLCYTAKQGTGWEQKIWMKALNVELAQTVLRKGDCTKARERQKKEELAESVIASLNNPNLKLISTSNGYSLAV